MATTIKPDQLAAAASAAGVDISSDSVTQLLDYVQGALLQPPRPPQRPEIVKYGAVDDDRSKNPDKLIDPPVERVDPFYWLRDDDRADPEILSLIRRENSFAQEVCRPLSKVRSEIYDEILSHINETDTSFPYPVDDYLYYTRTVKGLSYAIHCRKLGENGKEEVLCDINKLAEGKEFCDVRGVSPSQDHKMIMFRADYCGNETYALEIRDAATFELIDSIKDVAGAFWGRDMSEVFYTTHDEAHRPFKLWHHKLATTSTAPESSAEGDGSSAKVDRSNDTLLFTEVDERFYLSAHKTLDDRWVVISVDSAETSEIHVCDARRASIPQLLQLGEGGTPVGELPPPSFKCLRPREQKVEYDVASFDGHFYFCSNVGGQKNFALFRAPFSSIDTLPDSPGESQSTLPLGTTADASPEAIGNGWEPVIPYDEGTFLTDIEGFEGFLAVFGRRGGFTKAWLLKIGESELTPIEFDEPVYDVCDGPNCNFRATKLRLHFNSMTTPRTVLDVDTVTLEREVKHVKDVPNYDAQQYESVQLYATAKDGKTRVPMCAVFNKKLRGASSADQPFTKGPVMLYGFVSLTIFFFFFCLARANGVTFDDAVCAGMARMGVAWIRISAQFASLSSTVG